MKMMKKKKGFTLAEVLITLTLIGVISTLVIPSLVAKTGYSTKVVALKKAYNTISGAYTQATANSKVAYTSLLPLARGVSEYMNIKYYYDKDLKAVSSPGSEGGQGKATNWMVTEDGIAYQITQKIADGTCGNKKIDINTADSLATSGAAQPCYYVLIDIDGPKKGENQNADVTIDTSVTPNKITNITGDRFQVYVSATGITAGNPAWTGLAGAAAKILENESD